MVVPIVPIELGDVVRLKKPHACGANSWRVEKLGMDIGLQCTQCGRKVRLVRYDFDRRFRGFLERASLAQLQNEREHERHEDADQDSDA